MCKMQSAFSAVDIPPTVHVGSAKRNIFGLMFNMPLCYGFQNFYTQRLLSVTMLSTFLQGSVASARSCHNIELDFKRHLCSEVPRIVKNAVCFCLTCVFLDE